MRTSVRRPPGGRGEVRSACRGAAHLQRERASGAMRVSERQGSAPGGADDHVHRRDRVCVDAVAREGRGRCRGAAGEEDPGSALVEAPVVIQESADGEVLVPVAVEVAERRDRPAEVVVRIERNPLLSGCSRAPCLGPTGTAVPEESGAGARLPLWPWPVALRAREPPGAGADQRPRHDQQHQRRVLEPACQAGRFRGVPEPRSAGLRGQRGGERPQRARGGEDAQPAHGYIALPSGTIRPTRTAEVTKMPSNTVHTRRFRSWIRCM